MPFGINVESGKSTERDKIIFPITHNRRNVEIMKDEYLHLQTVMKKPIIALPVRLLHIENIQASLIF